MFESGVTLFPIRCNKPVIHHIINNITGTYIVLWRKQCPQEPKRYVCNQELTTLISIPSIQKTQDLLGTHLECRIMQSANHCMCRVLFWLEDDKWVCAASPNDTDRDIDNMSFDLSTTKRRRPAERMVSMTFHQQLKHTFVTLGTHTFPIEYVY